MMTGHMPIGYSLHNKLVHAPAVVCHSVCGVLCFYTYTINAHDATPLGSRDNPDMNACELSYQTSLQSMPSVSRDINGIV